MSTITLAVYACRAAGDNRDMLWAAADAKGGGSTVFEFAVPVEAEGLLLTAECGHGQAGEIVSHEGRAARLCNLSTPRLVHVDDACASCQYSYKALLPDCYPLVREAFAAALLKDPDLSGPERQIGAWAILWDKVRVA